jgi:signal recognition particle receptor subunit beta
MGHLLKWKEDFLKASPDALIVAAANKSDLASAMQAEELKNISTSLGTEFVRTSAKTGEGVEDLFMTLGRGITERNK